MESLSSMAVAAASFERSSSVLEASERVRPDRVRGVRMPRAFIRRRTRPASPAIPVATRRRFLPIGCGVGGDDGRVRAEGRDRSARAFHARGACAAPVAFSQCTRTTGARTTRPRPLSVRRPSDRPADRPIALLSFFTCLLLSIYHINIKN